MTRPERSDEGAQRTTVGSQVDHRLWDAAIHHRLHAEGVAPGKRDHDLKAERSNRIQFWLGRTILRRSGFPRKAGFNIKEVRKI